MIGRIKEKTTLIQALNSEKAELVAIVGRRRIGKTYLVRATYQYRIIFELTGIQNGSKKTQLQNFHLSLQQYGFNSQDHELNDWVTAFHHLTGQLESKMGSQKAVIFFDEFPWMATKRSDFLQGFSYFWNSWAIKQNIVVVICGSTASWMIQKVVNDRGGLHNRITRLIQLYPFSLMETQAFLKSKNINYPPYQILQMYMALGGVPMYLELVEKGRSVFENINEICFRPTSYLRNEFDNLYAALFNNHEKHIEIIRALARKRRGLTREEIVAQTSMTNGGTFTKILNELVVSDFVLEINTYGHKKKKALFRLKDPYSLFYLSFIEKEQNNPTADFGQIANSQAYRSWSGYTFEGICLTHIYQIKKALGISGVRTHAYTFHTKPKDSIPGTQIDLIIERGDQTLHLCEMKFTQSEYILSKNEADNLRTKQAVFRFHTGYKHHIFNTLLTTFGVEENNPSLSTLDQVINMEALFVE